MTFERVSDPMYYLTCDKCGKSETVDCEYDAFLEGFHKITVSIEPNDRSENTEVITHREGYFSSAILWLCDECFFEFMKDIKPYVPFFAEETNVNQEEKKL